MSLPLPPTVQGLVRGDVCSGLPTAATVASATASSGGVGGDHRTVSSRHGAALPGGRAGRAVRGGAQRRHPDQGVACAGSVRAWGLADSCWVAGGREQIHRAATHHSDARAACGCPALVFYAPASLHLRFPTTSSITIAPLPADAWRALCVGAGAVLTEWHLARPVAGGRPLQPAGSLCAAVPGAITLAAGVRLRV